jgi:16S rRNA processing protein RimM
VSSGAASGPPDRVLVGRVVRPHGLLGEVSVEVLTDFPERFREGAALDLAGPDGSLRHARVASVRPHGGRLLIRFEGVESLEPAEALRGLDVCAPPGDVPPRPDGYVFHWEVAGCATVDRNGAPLGVARDLVDMGGVALLVVDTPRGPRDVPFTRPIVVSVNLPKRTIVLDPPAGLLD